MTNMQLFIELMTNPQSPFSEMRHYGLLDIGTLAGNILSNVVMWFGKGLAAFLDACEEFANAAYNFLSFSGNSTFVSLYNTINQYLFIPLLIIFAIIAIRFTVGATRKGESKEILKNLGILFFVIAILPSIFSTINKNIFGKDFLYTIQGESTYSLTEYDNYSFDDLVRDGQISGSSEGTSVVGRASYRTNTQARHKIADTILQSNTYDFWYLYNNCSSLKSAFNGKSPNDATGNSSGDSEAIINELNKLQQNYSSSYEAQNVTFSGSVFDPNIGLDSEHGYNDIPDFFKWKVIPKKTATESTNTNTDGADTKISVTTTQLYEISENWGGLPIVNWGHECYIRYNVDYLNLFIQLIAVAVMYFCIGFSVIKLIVELMVHQLFGGIIAATDLTGGQRIKKFLGSIIGIYLALLLSALTILLFMAARNFAVNLLDTRGLGDSLITITLAIVMLDIPNIVARYFNINTGIRGGMGMAGMALYSTGRFAARSAGRMVRAPFRSAGQTFDNFQSARQERNRDMQRRTEQTERDAARDAARNAERNAERVNNSFDRATGEQARQKADFEERQNEFRNQHGTIGDYEKYEEPIMYEKDNEGSQKNTDAILQHAGASSSYNDYEGKQKSFENDINSGAISVGATNVDRQNALKENPAAIKDAKQGLYSSVAKEAELKGGTRSDYLKAAQSASEKLGIADKNSMYISYLADASYNAKHSAQIRNEAKNIQALDRKLSDSDAYIQAMSSVSGTYKFSRYNVEKVAEAELRDNGSLRQGNIYSQRPKDYHVGSKTAL